jgi:ABC-2 type transport system ATP-binding protein
MMMDIIKPDSGEIHILGEKLSESSKNKLGYLPEERGLYKKLSVIDSITYLASLKGMDVRSAEKKADELLEQTGMLPNKNKKIEELSKGMGQIIQFIVTIIHDPQLVILDEPFSGLDPVNTEILKQMILDLRNQGKAIILSTHQMNQVEELCDRILMINQGRAVLYGNLKEIKSKYRSNSIIVDFEGEPGKIPGVAEKRAHKDYVELVLDGKTSPNQVLARLVTTGITINRFEIATPSLNEIFLKVAGKNHG